MHNKVNKMSSQPAAVPQAEEPGKMFVGGLSWATTQDTLRAYFAQFGDIDECVVMYDRHTFRSRGYGYVRFRDPACVDRVMGSRPHIIDSKQVDPKPCCARGMERLIKQCKIFLGGLPLDANEAMVREFFAQFGNVVEAQVMYNPDKKRSRGFGFVAFDSEQVVRELLERRYVEFRGKSVELRRLETAASRVARNQHAAGGYQQYVGASNSAGYQRGAPNANWNVPPANWMPPGPGGWQNGAPNWMPPNGNANWAPAAGPAWSGPNANWNGASPNANWQNWGAQPQYAYWNGPRMPDRMSAAWAGQPMYAPNWGWAPSGMPTNGPAWQAASGGQPQAGPNAYYSSAPGPRFAPAQGGMANGAASGSARPTSAKAAGPTPNGHASFGIQAR